MILIPLRLASYTQITCNMLSGQRMGTGRRKLFHEDCPQERQRVSLTSPWDQNWLKRIYKVFLYLKDRNVEKTTGIAERHFSVMSWLLKHRFKTKEGLLRMSYWHHYYHPLSTRI
ncbi:MAG: hypothetical protein M0Z77_04745 [Thermoplasmatales archaeon]|nr:hypothetical protein [Thermoplasmatales archaeon]